MKQNTTIVRSVRAASSSGTARPRRVRPPYGLACLSLCLLTASSAGAATRTVTCTGEFGSGSGMAGSYLGDCRFAADSAAERQVQRACKQGATCTVRAVVAVRDGTLIVQRVLQVRQAAMPPSTNKSYLNEVGSALDGVLAPAAAGCDNPQDTAADRVSVLLDGLAQPAIQIHGRYCAVASGEGDKPVDNDWRAVLRATCGAVGVADDDLRTGRAGTKAEIVVEVRAGATKVDGEPLVRCPIRKRDTPVWWITNNYSFRGKYPSQ